MKIRECAPRKYFPVFLIVLFVIAFGLTGCSNPEKTKLAHVERGEAYLKERRFEEASLEFRNALQLDESMAAAHWGLARAFEGLGRIPEAMQELQRTIQLDQNNLDARVKLGNFYAYFGKMTEAEQLAREVLGKNPNHIEGHILMATVFAAQDKPQEALAELNRAIELDPKRVESYVALARFYMKRNEQAKVEETLLRAINANPSSAMAHTEYGKYLAQTNHLDQAEAEFKKAVDLEPSNRDSRFVLASFYLVNNQIEKAEAAYKALAELDKDKPDGRAVLADFYSAVGRMDDAIQIYKEMVAKAPDYMRGRYRLGEIMLQRGDIAGASQQVEEVLKRNQFDMQGRLLRARINLQRSNAKDSIEDLKEVLKQEPNSRSGLYYMAQASLKAGQLEQSRVYAGDLERYYPDYLPGKLLQVQINLTAGDNKNALNLSNELVNRLAKAVPDRDTTPQVLAELRARAFTVRGTTQMMLNNTQAARSDFEAAREQAPNDPDSYINLAAVSIKENKLGEAEQLYNRALAIDSLNFDGLYGLIKLYAQQKRLDVAHARIDQALSGQPLNAQLHYLKAQVYGYEQNAQGAESELRKTIEIDRNYIAAYTDLAALFINLKQTDQAISEYRKILAVNAADSSKASTYTLIGLLEDGRGSREAAIENYRKALEIDPGLMIAANNLAWNYAAYNLGNLDEALRLAQGVVQRDPNAVGFRDTLAWVYYKKGAHGAAVEQLQRVVKIESNNPLYRYHLGMALAGQGDKAGARRELETALRLGEKSGFAEADDARRALQTL